LAYFLYIRFPKPNLRLNKKLILSLLAIALLTTCKKEKTAEIDAVGTYTMQANKSVSGTTFTVETTPCMADNLLILRADGASLAFYKGAEPCHPYPSMTLGTKDTIKTAWQVKNGKLYFNNKQHGEIAVVNGRVQLTTRDTLRPPSVSYETELVNVFVKQ
jgi:hypothetical protein